MFYITFAGDHGWCSKASRHTKDRENERIAAAAGRARICFLIPIPIIKRCGALSIRILKAVLLKSECIAHRFVQHPSIKFLSVNIFEIIKISLFIIDQNIK